MPTISANVTKKELDAIREYANACGETMSNLIRKVMITDIAFLNFSRDTSDYNCEISIPLNSDSVEEDLLTLQTYNKIRRLLKIKELTKI